MEFLLIFCICTFSGFLTGLLGVGGGIVIVPMFLLVLPLFGINFSLQEIVGISATCVFINSSITAFYRRKENFLPFSSVAPIVFAIITGTVLGAYFSDFAPKQIILCIYIFVSLFSIYMLNGDFYFPLRNKTFVYLLFAAMGAISASIGIGGAILFATLLKCFWGKETKELLPTITILVLSHAFFAFISKFVLGHVTFMIIPIAFLASIIGSKIGVIISEKLTSKTLNILMSLVLVLGLIKIVHELFL